LQTGEKVHPKIQNEAIERKRRLDIHSSIQNIWLILAVWSILYVADYYLNLVYVKNYRRYLQAHILHEGSPELTPKFQKDVDQLRLISPRFLFNLILTNVLLYILWWCTVILEEPSIFSLAAGGCLLLEVTIHLRHWRNLATCTIVKRTAG